MPSIRKKFAGFIRQLSNSSTAECIDTNQIRSPSTENHGGCFIQRYLNGETRTKQPDILHGRTGQELPCLRLCRLGEEPLGAYTGPDIGLASVNRGREGHVTSQDPDVSFIDSEEDASRSTSENQLVSSRAGSLGMTRIRAMGQVFIVPGCPPAAVVRRSLPVALSQHKVQDHASLPTISEEVTSPTSLTSVTLPTSPLSSSSSPSSPSCSTLTPTVATPATTSCADPSDYQDFLSKLGILSLSLNPTDTRFSITKLDSPDDTLISGSASLTASSVTSPVESPPNSLPQPVVVDGRTNNSSQTNDESAVVAASTAADNPGISDAPGGRRGEERPQEEERQVAGIVGWNRPSGQAFGIATSLYERHPVTGEMAGNPLADAFAIVARSNNAVLALADGVNWGERAALAARSAIHGCIDYLNRALFSSVLTGPALTTSDVFLSLLRSFHAAHSLILQEGGLLTTLTAAVVAQVDVAATTHHLLNNSTDYRGRVQFVVCVCNVGDSLAYVYSAKTGIREITQGSHDINSMRDMRDALGALGPVDGQNPELNNLTCSMTVIEEGDIVFLTSDGISDNFDPVVGKFVVARKPDKLINNATNGKPLIARESSRNLPTVEAYQRHELTLLRMEDILRNGMLPTSGTNNNLKARQLCEDMVDFATRLTSAKRHLLEDVELYVDDQGRSLEKEEQKIRRRKICERLALIPGKLDHATVVAYEARLAQPDAGSTASPMPVV